MRQKNKHNVSIVKMVSMIMCLIGLMSSPSYGAQYETLSDTTFFGDILLIINYNHPHYESIPFLKSLYQEYFPHIVFAGPTHHPQVELCEHHQGYFCYQLLDQMMNKYPTYQGYLLVHDDCLINPWNFKRFDKTKIWANTSTVVTLETEMLNWKWWAMPIGKQAIAKVYTQLLPQYRTTLDENCGGNAVVYGYSDIVYIPVRYKDDITALCTLLLQEQSFLEIALPTLCSCLDQKSNWEFFNGLAVWTTEDTKKYYTYELDYLHRMKFSSPANRLFITRKFKQRIQ